MLEKLVGILHVERLDRAKSKAVRFKNVRRVFRD